jgi:hypothetical protein
MATFLILSIGLVAKIYVFSGCCKFYGFKVRVRWNCRRPSWRTHRFGTDWRTHANCEVRGRHSIRLPEVLSQMRSPSASSEKPNLDSKDLFQVCLVRIKRYDILWTVHHDIKCVRKVAVHL